MACRTLYDVKRVGYQAVAAADYMDGIGSDPITLKQIAAQGDIVIDTKGELLSYKQLNSVRYVDDTNVVLRKTGSIKFTRNFDRGLFDNHADILNAGFGEYLSTGTDENASIILTGKGGPLSGSDYFSVKSGSEVPVKGQLVHIPGYGVRIVTDVGASKFSVDRPIANAFASGEHIFNILKTFYLHNPKGTCDKSFNVVVENQKSSESGARQEFIVAMGCTVMVEFNLVFEKQLTVSITFTSPDIYMTDSNTLSAINWGSAEQASDPWICNLDESIYVNSSNAVTPYYPQMIELGRSLTEEQLKYPGGRNNIRGYFTRASLKPVIKVDIDEKGKLIRSYAAARDIVAWSFKQAQFAIYYPTCQGSVIDNVTNNSNFDAMSITYDVNHIPSATIEDVNLGSSGCFFGIFKA